MKRFIDEDTGKIVNILNNEEANKIVKIFIDFFFTETTMPEGRLNLVVLLRDFIKLTEIENIYKFIEYIEEYKKGLKLSKEDEKDFDVLYRFFRAYKDFSEPTINIEDAKNYISDMTNKEDELASKDKDSLDKTEKILNVLFENGFVLSRLAKISCDTWENKIQNQIKNDKKEAIISIEQEIAYQDLLEFASKDRIHSSKKISSVANDNKEKNANTTLSNKDVNTFVANTTNDKKEEKINVNNAQKSKVSIDVQVPEKKEPIKIEVETKKSEASDKKEEKVEKEPTIQINHGFDIASEPQITINTNKPETQKEKIADKKDEKEPEIQINRGIQLDDDVPARPSKSPVQEKVEKEPTIQINHGIQIDDVPSKPKASVSDAKVQADNNEPEKTKKDEGYISNIHIYVPGVDDDEKDPRSVNPLEIKNATEDVNLKDSVEFFSSVLDSRRSNDDDEEDSFRD